MNKHLYDFSGQTALVTGGTRGIGEAVSEAFLSAGAKVIALYAGNQEAADKFLQKQQTEKRLFIEKLDVAALEQCEEFWKKAPEKYGNISILVNNAGIRRDAVLAMLPEADWQAVIATNLTGTFHMCKFAVQHMLGERYGRIVNITSPSGKFGFSGQANYAASKAGMVALSKSLCKEVAKRGITVNCLSPGFIETDFIKDLPPELVKQYKESVPVRRFGKAGEVADAVLFLARRESAYITGATLEVTGGL